MRGTAVRARSDLVFRRWVRLVPGGRNAGTAVGPVGEFIGGVSVAGAAGLTVTGGRHYPGGTPADTGTAEFIRRHARIYVRVRTPEPVLLSRELARHGGSPVLAPDGSLEIDRLAAAHGLTLDELSTHSSSLEDAFLGLINRESRVK